MQKIHELDDNESVSSKESIQRRQGITSVCGSRMQDEKLESTRKMRKWGKEDNIPDTSGTSHRTGKSAKQESGRREAKVPTNIALHKLAKQGYSK